MFADGLTEPAAGAGAPARGPAGPAASVAASESSRDGFTVPSSRWQSEARHRCSHGGPGSDCGRATVTVTSEALASELSASLRVTVTVRLAG